MTSISFDLQRGLFVTQARTGIGAKLESLVSFCRMSGLARRVWRERLTYLSPVKLFQLEAEMARVKRESIVGDFAEFGVALGGSAILMATGLSGRRRFHGFDVFGMIPPPNALEDGEKSVERYNRIKEGQSVGIRGEEYYGYRTDLYEFVQDRLAAYGKPVASGGDVVLHRGLFEETWPQAQAQIPALSVVHIDCDWYDPVRYCLTVCHGKLSAGGAIIIDDYFAYPGAMKATDEFLAAHPAYEILSRNKHLIIKRRI